MESENLNQDSTNIVIVAKSADVDSAADRLLQYRGTQEVC